MDLFLIKIGFLPISLWDLLDILVVGYLIYRLFKLLRGSIAVNIFIGIIFLYVLYQLVSLLGMDLLSGILYNFFEVGFISLIIIFQPEVRRFLLLLGNSTLQRRSDLWNRLLDREIGGATSAAAASVETVKNAMLYMGRKRTGALLIASRGAGLETVISGGTPLNAELSEGLLLSIFNKESPLHDGAVVLEKSRITHAGTILPVSENMNLPPAVGLRHRAAVGVTEKMDVAAFIVSEETGHVSFAYGGELELKLNPERLEELLRLYL